MTTFESIDVNIPKGEIFFDWASASPLSKAASNVLTNYHSVMQREWDMPKFIREQTAQLSAVRLSIQHFIKAQSPESIILTRSASEGISLVAQGISWNIGDEIIISDLEHPANKLPWLSLAQLYGCHVIKIGSLNDGTINLHELKKKLCDRTRLVALTHVAYLHGTIQPINQVAELVHTISKAWLLVDGAQSVGRIPVDMQSLGCDFFVASGRKSLLAPLGTGFLYGRLDALELLLPQILNTRSARLLLNETFQPNTLPERLEGNLPDMGNLFALAESIHEFDHIGIEVIYRRIQTVGQYFIERLNEIRTLTTQLQWNSNLNAGIFSIRPTSRCQQTVSEIGNSLRRQHIIVATGEVLRVTLHIFNTFQEIDNLILALDQCT